MYFFFVLSVSSLCSLWFPIFFTTKPTEVYTKFTKCLLMYFFFFFFFVLSVSSLCSLWFPIFFTTKPTEVYTKFTQGFRCTSSLCPLCLLRALCGSLFFLPQSPPRVFPNTSSLCFLCLLRALCGSLFFLPQSPRRFTQRSPRVYGFKLPLITLFIPSFRRETLKFIRRPSL
jgi:hypothetical protein